MMGGRILTLYLAKRYAVAMLGTFFLCSVLIFMIDFVEVLRQSGKRGNVPARTLIWLTLLRLPAYTELLLAFAVQVGAIGALLMLNRKSELAVMRAAGMSVWQFLRPALVVAALIGIFTITVYNPVAAAARAEAERLFSEVFGRESNFLAAQSNGAWLRQEGADGASVLNANSASNRGMTLMGPMLVQYDKEGRFIERVDGDRANLRDGFWEVENAVVTRIGQPSERFSTYLVSTYLSPERVRDALGTAISVSFWELPAIIDATEKAGLSSSRFRIQYELLLSRPLLLLAMVLMGATVSLKSFRSGKIQSMVVYGMLGGFGFLLMAEVSRQIGVSGLVSPTLAVWTPVALTIVASMTVLLRQEDG
jgi:lipopolysaccharide export system permease protein